MKRSALAGVALLVACGGGGSGGAEGNEPVIAADGGGAGGAGAVTATGAVPELGTGGQTVSLAGQGGTGGSLPGGGAGGLVLEEAAERTPAAFSEKPPPEPCADGDNPPLTASELEDALVAAEALTLPELEAAYPTTLDGDLGYVPSESAGLDIIQGSGLALTEAELGGLDAHGFVLSERQRFPTFFYGYRQIYAEDLPLYVTVDSILHAVHQSYDDILLALERVYFEPELLALLTRMRTALAAASDIPEQTRADVDLYLAVPLGLLGGAPALPVAGADPAEIEAFHDAVLATEGVTPELFGEARTIDLSQFIPRGHYLYENEEYFRAMMWLGRIDLRIVSAAFGPPVVSRRQLAAALALSDIMDEESNAGWATMDQALRRFVGEVDSMTPPQAEGLRATLGIESIADLDAMTDDALTDAILASPYGMQRIASHFAAGGGGGESRPLSRSFTVLGQRYVLDSHVFSNVVYDRVAEKRMMPDPLDVAFAALGNNQALGLLRPELELYGYAGDLGGMRLLSDEHKCGYFESGMYTSWLGALRALSPPAGAFDPAAEGLPTLVGTAAWGRRILNTQLASWAELRHDTLLYAKQSYTGIPICEFPDAYVDPYPRAFEQIAILAQHGRELTTDIPRNADTTATLDSVYGYFSHLYEVALLLRDIAEHQKTGTPLTDEHMAFINDAVTVKRESAGCASIQRPVGWYPSLFFAMDTADQYDPTIADVHTQPADAAGTIVGRILHVATGMPRLFVTTIETCTGPRAYAGVASSYFERVTSDFDRLDDERWASELNEATPDDVPWLAPYVVR